MNHLPREPPSSHPSESPMFPLFLTICRPSLFSSDYQASQARSPRRPPAPTCVHAQETLSLILPQCLCLPVLSPGRCHHIREVTLRDDAPAAFHLILYHSHRSVTAPVTLRLTCLLAYLLIYCLFSH